MKQAANSKENFLILFFKSESSFVALDELPRFRLGKSLGDMRMDLAGLEINHIFSCRKRLPKAPKTQFLLILDENNLNRESLGFSG